MSCSEAATKKYSCSSRSSWPAGVLSFGYSTLEMFSDSFLSLDRADVVAGLKAFRSKCAGAAACHSRRVLTVSVP